MTSPPGGSRPGRAMGSGRAPAPRSEKLVKAVRERGGTVPVAASRGACRWRTGSC